jgi:hypothetical protein
VEREHRVREALGRVVDVGRVPPEGDRRAVHGTPVERGEDALALRHAVERLHGALHPATTGAPPADPSRP